MRFLTGEGKSRLKRFLTPRTARMGWLVLTGIASFVAMKVADYKEYQLGEVFCSSLLSQRDEIEFESQDFENEKSYASFRSTEPLDSVEQARAYSAELNGVLTATFCEARAIAELEDEQDHFMVVIRGSLDGSNRIIVSKIMSGDSCQ